MIHDPSVLGWDKIINHMCLKTKLQESGEAVYSQGRINLQQAVYPKSSRSNATNSSHACAMIGASALQEVKA